MLRALESRRRRPRAFLPALRLPRTCGRGRPRTQAVRAFGATERGPASWVRGRLARTSPSPANAGGWEAKTVLPWQTLRRAQTCGLEARGPRPRLRRGCDSLGGIAACGDVRAETPAHPGSPRLRRDLRRGYALRRGCGRRRSEARAAPSTSAASLAHAMSGSTLGKAAKVAKPQSVPAMTRSRPTAPA